MDKLKRLFVFFEKLMEKKCFGKTTISWENGKIVNVNHAENLTEFR